MTSATTQREDFVLKIAIKRADQTLQYADTNCIYRTEAAKTALKHSFTPQFIWMDQDCCLAMVCDEDGLFKQLPLNFFLEIPTSPWPIQPIVGDVAFVRTKPVNTWETEIYDYEVADLTAADIQQIQEILSWETQRKLAVEYINRSL